MSFYKPHPTCQIQELGEIYESVFGQKKDGFFIEAGAYDGETFSNTSCLADMGWFGIYFEPHPELYKKCEKRYANNGRVHVYERAVSQSVEPIKLYLGDALSTTVPESVDQANEIDWFKGVGMSREKFVEVQTDTLRNWVMPTLSVQVTPDILVIDVEGAELDVLKTYPWGEIPPPRMLIIETHQWSANALLRKDYAPIAAFIDALNLYTVISTDQINTIWLLNSHLEKAGY